MNVLFICRANAVRSQIAEAFYNQLSTFGSASSAGVDLANSIQGSDMRLPTMVCDLLAHFGIDASSQKRNWLTEELVSNVDVVVVLTTHPLPDYVKEAKKLVNWSDIPDIVSASEEVKKEVAAEIKERVLALVTDS